MASIQERVATIRSGDSATRELAAVGLRATRQRLALLRLLRGTREHPTAADLHRALVRLDRRVSRKTVYEILDSFVRAGLAGCVTDGGEPYRYEAKTVPHDHARCRVCERLFDVPRRAEDRFRNAAVPRGFAVEEIAVTLRGVCAACRRADP